MPMTNSELVMIEALHRITLLLAGRRGAGAAACTLALETLATVADIMRAERMAQ